MTNHPPKAAPAATSKKRNAASTVAFKRRDATGHLDPAYAAGLRALEGEREPRSSGDAFLHGMHSADPLAELLGEDFVRTANSGEDDAQNDAEVAEEVGGPFIESTAETEFGRGPDASNPLEATREPFPTG